MKVIDSREASARRALYDDTARRVFPHRPAEPAPPLEQHQLTQLARIASGIESLAERQQHGDPGLANAMRELAQQTATVGQLLAAQHATLRLLAETGALRIDVIERDGDDRIRSVSVVRN